MNDYRLRCVHCGKILQGKDRYWQVCLVNVLNGKPVNVFSPTCSDECAKAEQKDNIEWWQSYLTAVKNQSFQIMTVQDRFIGTSEENK